MRQLRLGFSDFWQSFDPTQNAFTRAFAAADNVVTSDVDAADILVFGTAGTVHERFVGTKVSYTGECSAPDWRRTDFAIGYEVTRDPRYLRLPLYALIAIDDQREGYPSQPARPWAERKRFCTFVYSVPGDPIRRQFVERLSEHRMVERPGTFMNNIDEPLLTARLDGDWRKSKVRYFSEFRFVIAFENRSSPGYTTEKLYDALLSGAIPIYWGNPDVDQDFDPGSFVWCRGASDIERVVDEVLAIDDDHTLATRLLDAPSSPVVSAEVYEERLVDFASRVAAFARNGGPRNARERALRLRSTAVARDLRRRTGSFARRAVWRRRP